jgi:ABC-type Mn2+/Zn2+ transport system permease subunit
MPDPRPLPPGNTLRIIRMAFLGGVVLFGAVVTFLVGRDPPSAPEMAGTLKIMNIVFVSAAALGILWIQRKHAAEQDSAARRSLNIVAWAFGEATAIFGAVHYLLVGSPVPYLVGLGMMLAAFALVPIRE